VDGLTVLYQIGVGLRLQSVQVKRRCFFSIVSICAVKRALELSVNLESIIIVFFINGVIGNVVNNTTLVGEVR